MALTREQSLSLMKMRQRQAQQAPAAAAPAPVKKPSLFETRPVMRPDDESETALRIASATSGGRFKPPQPEKGPSLQQVKKGGVGLTVGGLQGAIGGVLGTPGEILNIPSTVEKIGRAGLRYAQESRLPGVLSAGVKLVSALTGGGKVSTETAIPRLPIGVPEVTAGLFGETTDPAEELGRFVGEITAPVGTVVKGGAKLTRALISEVPPTREAIARTFEKRGYILDPAQLRADRPIKTAGATTTARAKNEKLATKEASRATGVETEDINPQFIASRTQELGRDYDRIFNRNFVIDTDAARTLVDIAKQEGKIFPAGVAPIGQTVNNIVIRWKDALAEAQLKAIQKGTQRIIDKQQRGGVARWRKDWPTLISSTDANAPAWLGPMQSKVNDLSARLGLSRVPEVYAGTPSRESVYGMATADGYIMIRSNLDEPGALTTAMHEFGHQADYQYFRYQPDSVKKELVAAWLDERQKFPLGTKTLEQLRPLTAQKYGSIKRKVPDVESDNGYFRNFAEWYAEQTSRWLSKTDKPKTVIEKYFAGAAKNWNDVYASVVGYTPLREEVSSFFNAAWKNPETAGLTIQTAAQPTIRASAELPILPLENVTAPISGKELQRLRSNLTDLARSETDGLKRRAISELITQIDTQIIAKSNPDILPMLKSTNSKYAATAALADGLKDGWVTGGRVDLSRLGDYVAGEVPAMQFGAGTSRHPLYELGYGGRELNLTSRSAGQQIPGSDFTQAVRAPLLFAAKTVGARSQVARAAQRAVSSKELRRMQAEQAARATRRGGTP